MSGLRLALLAGSTVGLGLWLIICQFARAHPQLRGALDRLAPQEGSGHRSQVEVDQDLQDKLGLWVQRRVPPGAWLAAPTRELALLRIQVHRHYGERALYALIGLVFPAIVAFLLGVLGWWPPFVFPLAAGLLFGAVLSFLPVYNAHDDAKEARQEFARALSAYIDLVALERAAGTGATQALESAANVGDSWVFQRLQEELARSRWAQEAPWDSLEQLSAELGLPELQDLADIMRLSGESGVGVYDQLRARSQGLRTALLTSEQGRANASAEQMTLPVSVMSLIFLMLLAAPPVLRAFFGS